MPTYAEDEDGSLCGGTYFRKWVDPLSKGTGTTRNPENGEEKDAAEWALMHTYVDGGDSADYEEYTWYPVRRRSC